MDNKIFVTALLGFLAWIALSVTELQTNTAVIAIKVEENHKMLSVLWKNFLEEKNGNLAKFNVKASQ